jgi:hypothetical protein
MSPAQAVDSPGGARRQYAERKAGGQRDRGLAGDSEHDKRYRVGRADAGGQRLRHLLREEDGQLSDEQKPDESRQ